MKKFLSLVLALVMTMSLVTVSAGAYTDDSKVDYNEAVDVISALGIVGGYPDGSFKPQGTLTRGAAAKIICIMTLGADGAAALPTNITSYPDVVAGSTYASYIAYCKAEGIVSGYADGTFKPGNTLTGFAFLKMLLGALGYDADIEGLNDPNSWQIKTAQLAKKIGLYEGNDNFNGNLAATREAACLYALNTLKAQTVYYNQSSVINIGGVEIKQTSSAQPEWDDAAPHTDAHQLYENNFNKLSMATVTDDMGRPATEYKITGVHGKDIGTYPQTAKVTYTTKFKSKDVYKDLGLDADNYYFYAVVDGVSTPYTAKATALNPGKYSDTEFYGNGITTEIYLAKNTNVGTIVVSNPAIVKVTKVTAAKDDVDRNINVKGGTLAVNGFKTEEFAKDDMLLVTAGKKVGTTTTVITSAVAVEKKTGTVTKVVAGDSIYVDGTKYELSDSAYKELTTPAVGDEVEFYLDAAGYMLKIEDVTTEVDLSNLAFVEKAGYTSTGDYDDEAVYKATLRYADGTSKIVVTKANYTSYAHSLVTFKTNSKGKVELTAGTSLGLADDNFYTYSGGLVKGNPAVGSDVANNETVYVYVDHDSTDGYTAKVYTGYKNAPSVTGANVWYYVDGTVTLAFVYDFASAPDNKNDSYIIYKSSAKLTEEKGTDEKFYETLMIEGGKVVTVKVKGSIYTNPGAKVWAVGGTTVDDDGVITAVTGTSLPTASTSVEVSKGIVKLSTGSYAYADDVAVWHLNKKLTSAELIGIDDVVKSTSATDVYSVVYYVVDSDDAHVITKMFVIDYE